MSFALPESLRDYIDARVRSGEYGNTSEYLRDLIRRDQQEQAARRLRELITEGLESGPATPLTKKRIAELREQALPAELVTPAWLRPRAEADLVERSRYYAAEAGDDVAARFFDSAIAALRAVERMPGTGSPRIGELCEHPRTADAAHRRVPVRLVLPRAIRPPRRRPTARRHTGPRRHP